MYPLSVTAGMVGLLKSILHGSKRRSEFIDGFHGAPKGIATLSTDLKAFDEVLGMLMGRRQVFPKSVTMPLAAHTSRELFRRLSGV
jgi:hypothetical protein